ncbi:hypothetical protein BDR26DRAFT_860181 [Obelidium mucronatum]|nr:hypothetical protein BDR26DRAFT_860181 [Obelidium mucronatum]
MSETDFETIRELALKIHRIQNASNLSPTTLFTTTSTCLLTVSPSELALYDKLKASITEVEPGDKQLQQRQSNTSILNYLGLAWTTAPDPSTESLNSSQLQSLCLKGDNHQAIINMDSVPQLKILHISGINQCLLGDFPPEASIQTLFLTDSSIKETDASDLSISHLGKYILRIVSNPLYSSGLLFSRVAVLSSKLTEISPTIIPHLANVTYLNLSGNNIASFPSNLSVLPHLETLDLSHNKLHSLDIQLKGSTKVASSVSKFNPKQSQNQNTTINFKALVCLILRHNSIEGIGDWSGVFPVLQTLDLSFNNILDVFELKAISVLDSCSDLIVAGNGISKQPSHRMNIYTYFKSKAVSLKIDGMLPSPAESKEILAGLTIAATSSVIAAKSQQESELKKKKSSPIKSATSNTKRKGRRAIAIVEDLSGGAPEENLDGVQPTGLFVSTPHSVGGSSNTVIPETSMNKSSAKLPIVHIDPDSLDLLMESMDERSVTPNSQRMSPVHWNHNDAPMTSALTSIQSAEANTSTENNKSFTSPPILGSSRNSSTTSGLPQREERSLSKYFDAHQDFVSSSSNAGTRSSSSNSSVASEDELDPKISTSLPSDTSFAIIGNNVSPPRVGGTEISPILNGAGEPAIQRSPHGLGPSPFRGSSGRLEKIEETIALSSKSHQNRPLISESISSAAFRIQQIPLGKPNFPKMTTRGNQFGTTKYFLQKQLLKHHPYRHHQFLTTEFSTKPSSSASSSGMTPLSNTPAASRKLTDPIATASMKPPNSAFVATAEWHKKMAQQERNNLNVNSQRAGPAKSVNSRSTGALGGFEEALVVSHLPPQKPLMASGGMSMSSGSSGRLGGYHSGSSSVFGGSVAGPSSAVALDSIGPYRRVYEFEPRNGGDEESVRSRNVHVTFAEGGETGSGARRTVGSLPISNPGGANRRDAGHSSLSRSLALGSYRSMSNEPRAAVGVRRPTGNDPSGELGGGIGADMAPRLVLARPVANPMVTHQRRVKGDDSEAGSDRSGSVYSAFHPRQSNRTIAGSMFSGDSGRFSVFSGLTGLTRVSGIPENSSHNSSRHLSQSLPFPRTPNIPFLSINNSLQLHLKFKVLLNDQEKILAWVPGSVVPQVSPYIQGIAANAAASNESFISTFLSPVASTQLDTSQDSTTRLTIERMQTVERASYLLLTDKGLYIFTPTFQMPYDPFSRGNTNATASSLAATDSAASSHLSNVIAQVRYDDPSRILKLARKIPLSHLARIDVGPNRQFLGIHFLANDDGTATAPTGDRAGNPTLRRVSGIGVEGSLKSGGKGQPLRKKSSMSLTQNPLSGIRSLVFLSRDRSGTSRILDSLVPVLYESKPGSSKFSIRGEDGKVKIVNQDVEWSLTALREKVLLAPGTSVNVILNDVDVDGKFDWRDVLAKKQNKSTAPPSSGGKGWFSDLLNTPLSSGSRQPAYPSLEQTNSPVSRIRTIVNDTDCDSATSNTVVLNKVNFEFLKLYLLVGWIVPHRPLQHPPSKLRVAPSLSVTVNSVSLIATKDYIYLTSERFDVWPPPLFPASTLPAPTVNAPFLEHAASLAATLPRSGSSPSLNSLSSTPTPPANDRPIPDPFKGLSASQIPQYSPPLRVGRVRDLVRCERWKTWRWKLGQQITQVEEASLLEQKVAALIQNGAIGVVKVVEDEWPIGGVKSSGVSSNIEKARRAGATSGWDWWVRMVFKEPVESSESTTSHKVSGMADSPSSSASVSSPSSSVPVATSGEYFWDIVFATLDAANEFLEFVKDVRGVKPVHETEEMAAVSGFENDELISGDGRNEDLLSQSAGDEFEDIDFARDSRLFDKVAWDGVGLVIGDD